MGSEKRNRLDLCGVLLVLPILPISYVSIETKYNNSIYTYIPLYIYIGFLGIGKK